MTLRRARSRVVFATGCALAGLLSSRVSNAQAIEGASAPTAGTTSPASPPPPPPPSPATHEDRWYGWQPLIADGASTALLVAGTVFVVRAAASDTSASSVVLLAPVSLGVLGYLFAAPTIHWAHGRVGTGFASLALRALAPLAGVGMGALVQGVAGHDNTSGGIVGGLVGATAAIVVDDAVLARETVVTRPVATMSLTPSVDRERRAGLLTFRATF
jgi:hypothetical protein